MPYKDPEKRREAARRNGRAWYLKNKKKVLENNAKRKKTLQDRWKQYKASKACAVCGFSHPAVIEFHHVIRKNKRSVNRLISDGRFRAAINEAEGKCIPLCANCHRIHHFNERHGVPARKRPLKIK